MLGLRYPNHSHSSCRRDFRTVVSASAMPDPRVPISVSGCWAPAVRKPSLQIWPAHRADLLGGGLVAPSRPPVRAHSADCGAHTPVRTSNAHTGKRHARLTAGCCRGGWTSASLSSPPPPALAVQCSGPC